MNISLNWLKDYIDLDGISLNEILDKLTIIGLEVEEVINQRASFNKIIVGYVKEKGKHPNADKLSVCKVEDGKNVYDVVCGAPNVEKGQKVVFAQIGAIIPNGGFEIRKAKIRGEKSEGMICSESELEISENHDGIMVLDESAQVGQNISEYFGLDDVIIDVAITPNRSDALSHIGIARDLAAVFGKDVKLPKITLIESDESAHNLASIEIENLTDCPRYSGKVVTGVEIKDSPKWMQQRLKNIGLRPINNIVDVTNYVLHEFGQPLHGFDLDTLAEKKIIVKSATKGEKFVTLDSKERELDEDDLMICDGEKSVAIAGVMGGENSEVNPNTKNVLIESAYFRPSAVRKTSKKLGLSTDASYRFERGTDPNITFIAAERAAQLIAETSGGKVAKGVIDVYPQIIPARKVLLRFSRISKILGYEIPKEEVKAIFSDLGMEVNSVSDEEISITVPTSRHDIEREIDLIEEVARIYGYDKIPNVEKVSITLDDKIDQSAFNDNLRQILTGLGFNEIITNSLLSDQIANKFGNGVGILNPQSSEMSFLRTSLIPGALNTLSKNINVKEKDLCLFEMGKVFNKSNEDNIKSFDDFVENEHLIMISTGQIEQNEWYSESRKSDIYDLKGNITSLLKSLKMETKVQIKNTQEENVFFDQYFELRFRKQGLVGTAGKLKKEFCNLLDVKQEVYCAIFDLEALKKIGANEVSFNELLRYPKVERDFAFILDKHIRYEDIIKTAYSQSSNLLKNIKLFDIFESDSLGESKKSLAFELEYYDESRTLEESEVDDDFWKLIEAIKTKFNAELRGK